MSVTIYDVAREAGVSMATVSRVINGSANVKPSTRKKVLRVIEELGYRPNAVARGLASKKTTTIGVILPDISSIFFAELARGIEDIAAMYHYNIILSSSDQNVDKELKLINNLMEKQVDGLLFLGSAVGEEHRRLFQSSLPVVLVATEDTQGELPSVGIDITRAAYEAVHYFLSGGHTRIGFLTESLQSNLGKQRFAGYAEALKAWGIAVDETLVMEIHPFYERSLKATKTLLSLPKPPTAIFAANDEVAIGAIHAIQDAGRSVPDDVEVIGFDNTRLAQMVRPMLTSVVQPLYDIGAVAMRLLTKLIQQEEVGMKTVILPHRLEFRQSTRSSQQTQQDGSVSKEA